jgi:hypothetical protein
MPYALIYSVRSDNRLETDAPATQQRLERPWWVISAQIFERDRANVAGLRFRLPGPKQKVLGSKWLYKVLRHA